MMVMGAPPAGAGFLTGFAGPVASELALPGFGVLPNLAGAVVAWVLIAAWFWALASGFA